jgi:uroporphyrinogen-III synthase
MILITRPLADAANMQEILQKSGHEVCLEPMLGVNILSPKIPESNFYITTSNHAEGFVPQHGQHLSIPQNGENASELLNFILANFSAADGKFTYLRGNEITLDIKTALQDAGFDADEVVVYKTTKPAEFSQNLLDKIYQIKVATFFSAASLTNFLELVKKHNLKEAIKGITLLALSDKIATKCGKYDFKEIFVADLPNQQSLIEKLEEIL